MGGSPKRGTTAASGMSRGRLILLAVLVLQLVLVVCLMKAPRLVFLGTPSRSSDLIGSADEAAGGSWLWWRFVAKKAVVEAPGDCIDGNGRVVKEFGKGSAIKCESHSTLRKVNALVSFRNASAHGAVGLPRESRLRGGITIRPIEARNGSVVEEMRAARKRRFRVEQDLRSRNRSAVEEFGATRQRRVRVEEGLRVRNERVGGELGSGRQRRVGVDPNLPARRASVVEDLRLARQRRVRVEQDLPATPFSSDAAREPSISSRSRGSIRESLERDSLRFRGRGGYGDRLRGDVKAEDDEVETRAVNESAAIATAARIRASERVSSEDDPDVAIARSEVNYVARRANFGPLPGYNASRSNTSLEISEALPRNSTNLKELDPVTNAAAPDTQLGAYNISLGDALEANVSGIHNATLSAHFGAHNSSLRDALEANVSGIHNVTLSAHFGAHNSSLRDALEANVSGIHNATLSAHFEAHNVSLRDALEVNVSSIHNATLSAHFGAHNVSLRDALEANVSSIHNATLSAHFGAHNVSLRDALEVNVSSIHNATLSAQFGAHNASLLDAVKANVSNIQNGTCLQGLIYVYTLPKKFNTELLENCSSLLQWGDRCQELSNSGLGPSLAFSPLRHSQKRVNHSGGPWYGTDQFNGEVIFHQRLLTHPCRTRNPELARAFYIPYYGGLDVARFLFNVTNKKFTAADRDKLGGELVEWLVRSPYWKRRQGVDHFLMLGRITWDFRRKGSHGWGSSLIYMPEMANVTKLALERSPWDDTEMAIPYPTGFHPRDDDEVVEWQNSLRKMRRVLLFSFAGAPRKEFANDFRIDLFGQCKRAKSCEVLDCSERKCEDDPQAATRLFMRSTFCLQPRGDSFTRRSIFDSLIAGCIPVFFWTKSAYLQYNWHLPKEYSSYSVFIPKNDIRSGAQIEEILLKISPAKVQQMQETILAMIPTLVYAGPEHELVKFKDAFDTTIDKVMANFGSRINQTTPVIKQALPVKEMEQVVTVRT